MKAGDKVRLTRDCTLGTYYPELSQDSIHTIQSPTSIYGDTLVTLMAGGEGRPACLVFRTDVEIVEDEPVKPGFNCKAGRDSWGNLGMPYLQNETTIPDCQLEEAEAAMLSRLRAKKVYRQLQAETLCLFGNKNEVKG